VETTALKVQAGLESPTPLLPTASTITPKRDVNSNHRKPMEKQIHGFPSALLPTKEKDICASQLVLQVRRRLISTARELNTLHWKVNLNAGTDRPWSMACVSLNAVVNLWGRVPSVGPNVLTVSTRTAELSAPHLNQFVITLQKSMVHQRVSSISFMKLRPWSTVTAMS
jgi:hypothetical protein